MCIRDRVDAAAVVSSFFIFGPETGLFSTIGLAAKSLVIDDVIANLNLCKCFNIICDDPVSYTHLGEERELSKMRSTSGCAS